MRGNVTGLPLAYIPCSGIVGGCISKGQCGFFCLLVYFYPMKYYIPAFVWAAFILFATIANVSTLESLQLRDLFAYDKPIHMFLFGTQAYLLMYAWYKTRGLQHTTVLYICLVSILYGVLTECLQGFLTTTRSFDYLDMIGDTAGVVVVYVGYRFWRK